MREPETSLVPRNVQELETFGKIFVDSGFFPDSIAVAQAMVKIAAGHELGLSPVQSMTGIHVIKNRVTLSAGLMASLLKKAGYSWKIKKFDNTIVELIIFYKGEELGPSSFSLEDAKSAGLSGENWRKFPRNMLFARAISNAARWYAPEVITGCYTPEEMEQQDASGQNNPPETLDIVPSNDKATRRPGDQATRRPGENNPQGYFFAIAKERGLSENQQRTLLCVESRSDASEQLLLDSGAMLSELFDEELPYLSELLDSSDMEDLRKAWSWLPQHMKESKEIFRAKEYLKLRFSEND